MYMYKWFNSYFLCEEEFATCLGSNVRAVTLENSEKFKEHLNLFILNREFSKNQKKNEALKAFFEYEMDNIMLIHDPMFFNLNRVEKVDDQWLFIKEYTPGLRLSDIIYKESSPRMNLNILLVVFNEICEGITSILGLLSNEGKIPHGMIHPFNIVITEKGEIKLDNYFFGKVLSKLDIKRDDFLEYYGNCLPINKKKLIQFSSQSDLIQLGMLFLELINGMEIPKDISLSEVEEIVERSKIVSVSSKVALTEEDIKVFLKRTLQIAPEGNFSSVEEMAQSAKSNFIETEKFKLSKEEFPAFISSHFKLDLLSLTNILRSEQVRDYSDKAKKLPQELRSAIEKIKNFYGESKYDEASSAIDKALKKFPDNKEILNLREILERSIKSKTKPVKTGKQIVIIEDDLITLKILEKAVIRLGFEVFTAQDGAEGYELVRRVKPDLLISDLLIPKIHGIDLCKKIKADESLKGTPIVLMSAVYKGSKYMPEIMHTDADYFIEKPIDINKLKNIIKKLT